MTRSQLLYQVVRAEGDRGSVIALHGHNGSLRELGPLLQALGPELRAVAVEAARGVYEGHLLTGYTWFGTGEDGRPEPASFGDSLWQVEQFVYDDRERQGPDPPAPFLLGYDLGGVLALAEALVLPDHLSGVVSILGCMPEIPGWTPPAGRIDGFPILLVSDAEERSASALESSGADVQTLDIAGARELGPAVVAAVREWLRTHEPTGSHS